MLAARERRQLIAEQIIARGEIEFASLAMEFGVSEMTVRRDIDQLEQDGFARKVLGGAIAILGEGLEPTFETRASMAANEKSHIASAAVDGLTRGETVILDGGSTVLAVARQIRGRDLALTVITPSVLVALELTDEANTSVFVTGGRARPGELSLIGTDAEEFFSRYNAGTFVMGVAGVDAKRGITDYHSGESAVKRAAMAAADRTIVVVDHSKLGVTQLVRVSALEDVQAIITDGHPAHPTLEAARQLGVSVMCVPTVQPSPDVSR